MESASVVPKAKRRAEIFDGHDITCREITIESSQAILERFEPSLDVISLATAYHNVLKPKSLGWPPIPRTTVGSDDRLAFAITKRSPQKSQDINGLAVLGDVQVHHLPILRVYSCENEDPAASGANFRFIGDDTASFPPFECELSQSFAQSLEPLPDRDMGCPNSQVAQESAEPSKT
jgi:hypothetical protein